MVVITWSNNAWVLDCFATANCSSVSAVVTLMLIGGFGILSWHWFLNECCKSFLSVYCLIGEASLIYNMIKSYEVFNKWNLLGWFVSSGCRDWLPKFATGLNVIIGCSSKSIWLTRLLFCQNGSSMRGSFWQKNSFITDILFELKPIIIFSPVANFGNQSICTTIKIN